MEYTNIEHMTITGQGDARHKLMFLNRRISELQVAHMEYIHAREYWFGLACERQLKTLDQKTAWEEFEKSLECDERARQTYSELQDYHQEKAKIEAFMKQLAIEWEEQVKEFRIKHKEELEEKNRRVDSCYVVVSSALESSNK